MPKPGAREGGKENVGKQVNTIATLLRDMSPGRKLIFNGLQVPGGFKYVPDRRSLVRHPWCENEHMRPVFVTQVVNEVPGILFCNFREVRPEDVRASTRIAEATPFEEDVDFVRVEGDAVVLAYQAAISDYAWDEKAPHGPRVEFRVRPNSERARVYATNDDAKDAPFQRFWHVEIDRSEHPAFGGSAFEERQSYVHQRFAVYDLAEHEQLMSLFHPWRV